MFVIAFLGLGLLWVSTLCLAPIVTARSGDGPSNTWASLVYFAASYVCHQQPARSFFVAGFKLPVCARCLGIYAAVPFGALLMLVWRRSPSTIWYRRLLLIACIPTALTLTIEWSGLADPGNRVRAASGAVLGLVVSAVVAAAIEEKLE